MPGKHNKIGPKSHTPKPIMAGRSKLMKFQGHKGSNLMKKGTVKVKLSKKDGSFSEEIKPYIVKDKKNKAVVEIPKDKLYSQDLKPYTNTTYISEDSKGNTTYTEPYPTSESLSVGDYRDSKRKNRRDNFKAAALAGLTAMAYRSMGRGTDR